MRRAFALGLAAACLAGACASESADAQAVPPITLTDTSTPAELAAIEARTARLKAVADELKANPPRTDVAAMMKEAKADPAIRAALAEKSRSTDAILRDDSRSTALILKAADARPGMRALDIGSGGGYLALLLATMVGGSSGDGGHVDIHNTPGWIAQFPGMDPDAQKRRVAAKNVGWITTPWGNDLPGEPGSYDIVMLGQVYHDVILEAGDFMGMNKKYFELLKPGGRVVVEDHDAIDAQPLGQQVGLHRVSHEQTIAQFETVGFKLVDLILIESTYDDRRFNVFRPGVRGRTDRFIATFEKPKT